MRSVLYSPRFVVLALAIFLASCNGAPATRQPEVAASRPVNASAPAIISDEEAVRQLVMAESEAVLQQDMERLADLWLEDAWVRDAKHTPDDESDDAVWRGLDAVLDRYVVLVFPGNPQFAAPEILEVSIQGDVAVVRSTTRIGDEVSPAGDRWELEKRDGRWRLRSLTYNLEPLAQ